MKGPLPIWYLELFHQFSPPSEISSSLAGYATQMPMIVWKYGAGLEKVSLSVLHSASSYGVSALQSAPSACVALTPSSALNFAAS